MATQQRRNTAQLSEAMSQLEGRMQTLEANLQQAIHNNRLGLNDAITEASARVDREVRSQTSRIDIHIKQSNTAITVCQEVINNRDSINALSANLEALKDKIEEFEERLFIDADDDPSVKTKVENFIKLIDDNELKTSQSARKIIETEASFREKKADFDRLYDKELKDINNTINELTTRVEKLLPGATSAGLSAAYDTSKKLHFRNSLIWTGLFALAMVLICGLGFYSVHVNADNMKDYFDVFKAMIKISPFEIPLVWFAWIASKRIKEENRLHEEHLHKWTIVRSYDGFSKQAQELDEKEGVAKELFEKVLSAYSTNPSPVIDVKSANTPIEKLWEDLMGLVKKSPEKTKEIAEAIKKIDRS